MSAEDDLFGSLGDVDDLFGSLGDVEEASVRVPLPFGYGQQEHQVILALGGFRETCLCHKLEEAKRDNAAILARAKQIVVALQGSIRVTDEAK